MSRILHDQSNAEYHSEGGYSSTYIKDWALRSPAHAEYAEKTINPYTADEGTAAHLVFEGKPELVFEAGEIRRGTVWEEAKKQAIAVGGVALPKKAYKNAMGAAKAPAFILLCTLTDTTEKAWTIRKNPPFSRSIPPLA